MEDGSGEREVESDFKNMHREKEGVKKRRTITLEHFDYKLLFFF